MIHFITTDEALAAVTPHLYRADTIGLDIETTGLDPFTDKILLVQLGDKDNQYVIDSRRVNLQPIVALLEDRNVRKVGHNLKFEYKMLKGCLGVELECVRDTMIMEQLLLNGKIEKTDKASDDVEDANDSEDGGEELERVEHGKVAGRLDGEPFYGYGLAATLERHFGFVMKKDMQKSFIGFEGEFSQDQINYAAKDIEWVIPLYEKQRKEAESLGMISTMMIECNALPALGDMELNGVLVDLPMWVGLMQKHRDAAVAAAEAMLEIVSPYVDEDDLRLKYPAEMLTVPKTGVVVTKENQGRFLAARRELLARIGRRKNWEIQAAAENKEIRAERSRLRDAIMKAKEEKKATGAKDVIIPKLPKLEKPAPLQEDEWVDEFGLLEGYNAAKESQKSKHKGGVNFGSSKAIVRFLRELGVKVPTYNRVTHKVDKLEVVKSDKATIKKIKGVKFVDLLKEYRSNMMRISTFGWAYVDAIHPVTGRVHPDYKQIGTETGRLAKYGSVNMLNIPRDKDYRHSFVARGGYLIGTHDFSGCELRILAEISEDQNLIDPFMRGEDLHCYVASKLFRVPVTKKNENAKLRTPAKALNFGIAYGMGAGRLYDDLNSDGFPIEFNEARRLFDSYTKEFSGGYNFIKQCGKDAMASGTAVNINGRRRYWVLPKKFASGAINKEYERRMATIARQAGNFHIQSVNADITKIAMASIRRYIKDNRLDAKLLFQVYDEICTEASEAIKDTFFPKLVDLMVESAHIFLKTVRMEVDGHVGPSWTK